MQSGTHERDQAPQQLHHPAQASLACNLLVLQFPPDGEVPQSQERNVRVVGGVVPRFRLQRVLGIHAHELLHCICRALAFPVTEELPPQALALQNPLDPLGAAVDVAP